MVDPHAGAAGGLPGVHRAGLREITGVRVLGVEADLDRVAAERELVLRQREGLAGGDAQLQLDEVEAGHALGDRVLDLQAGVHLQEVELAAGVEHELDGAGADVLDAAGGGHCSGAHALAQGGVDGGRG